MRSFVRTIPSLLIFRKEIAEFLLQGAVSAVSSIAEVAEARGLMSYGASRIDLFRRAASYVADILDRRETG